jgi:hypothetical protein
MQAYGFAELQRKPFMRAGDRQAKVKLSLCLFNRAPLHKDVWGIVGSPIPPPFLTSAVDGGFTFLLLYPRGNQPAVLFVQEVEWAP